MRFKTFLISALATLPVLGSASTVAQSAPHDPCSYFVSPQGDDDNDGRTAATAFATLERAQSAVRRGMARVVCLRAGAYPRGAPLRLTAADSGETWRYYEPDGVDSAILEGYGRVSGGMIYIEGARGVTIDGITIRHFADYGILIGGLQSGNSTDRIVNCNVGFNTITSWSSAGIASFAAPDVTIARNYVHDVGSQGILVSEYENARESIAGTVISDNVVLHAVQRRSDGGGIYVSMHGGEQGPPHAVFVRSNYVADYGSAVTSGVRGIYLDDNANNVDVTGNVVGPPAEGTVTASNSALTAAFLIHNGHDNHISGNIVDLGASGRVSVAIWGYDKDSFVGMAGSTFTGNIVLSSYRGAQQNNPGRGVTAQSYFQDTSLPASDFTIRDNIYYNSAGGLIDTGGALVGDRNPVLADPQVSGPTYKIASGSRALESPVNFTPIIGEWGPPHFIMPKISTAPR